MVRPPSPPKPAWSVRLCDLMVLGFAAWTLSCHLVVFSGGGLHALLVAAPVVVGIGWFGMRRILDPWPRESSVIPAGGPSVRGVALAVIATILLGVLYLQSRSVIALWWAAVVYLACAYGLCCRGQQEWGSPHRDRHWEIALWAMALGAALVPLFVHWPNADDTFYINVAVAAVDAPGFPLLRYDTLHGIEGLPIILPVYKVQSFELLPAALAYLTPLSVIEAAHWLVPAAFALFVPLALARLCRLMAPRTWIWTLAVLLAVLLVTAETQQSYALTALPRMHQGKGLLVTVFIPLIIVYAAEFARRPAVRSWILLLAVQIAAVGANSTALWSAPMLAFTTWAIAGGPARWKLKSAAAAGATSLYVVSLGWLLRAETATIMTDYASWIPGSGATTDIMRRSWTKMVGDGPLALASLAAVLGAWVFCWPAATRRIAIGLPLGLLLTLFNPFLSGLVASKLTGEMTYYRVLWNLPIPLFLALLCTAPLAIGSVRAWKTLTCLGLTGILLFALPQHYLWSWHFIRIAPLELKVDPPAYEAARELVGIVPPKSHVLASPLVSNWIGTFSDHPYALAPRRHYLRFSQQAIGKSEVLRRSRMMEILEHFAFPKASDKGARLQTLDGGREYFDPDSLLATLAAGLEHYDVRGLCFPNTSDGDLRLLLERESYREVWRNGVYQNWAKARD